MCLAQQAKSKKDITRIKGMIQTIDETQRALPIHRINELKLLELMTSPYNQSLIAMIQVELDYLKKLREIKKKQNQGSKYSLPKHNYQSSKTHIARMINDENRVNVLHEHYGTSREHLPARKASQSKIIPFKPNVLLSNRTSKKKLSPSNSRHSKSKSPSPLSQKIKPVLDSVRSKERANQKKRKPSP